MTLPGRILNFLEREAHAAAITKHWVCWKGKPPLHATAWPYAPLLSDNKSCLLPVAVEKYIHEDPMLVPLLDMLRQAGKKVFLATNSLWVSLLGWKPDP